MYAGRPIILLANQFLFGLALIISTRELLIGNPDGIGFSLLLVVMANPGLILSTSLLHWRHGLYLITFGNVERSLKSNYLFFWVEKKY